MKCLFYTVLLTEFMLFPLLHNAQAEVFESVQGKQFFITGFSTGTIPVFNEVLVFSEDGSFLMKKMENHGDGEYYEYHRGMFYFIFNNRTGVDVQYAEAFGFSVNTIIGQMVVGTGRFMIDFTHEPMLFSGLEVFQPDNVDTTANP